MSSDSSKAGKIWEQQALAACEKLPTFRALQDYAFEHIREVCQERQEEIRLLCLGIGLGALADRLQKAHLPLHISGIDHTHDVLIGCEERLSATRVGTLQEAQDTASPVVVLGDVAQAHLPENQLHIVEATLCLHHLRKEPLQELLAKIHASLVPGGSLFVGELDVDLATTVEANLAAGRDPIDLEREEDMDAIHQAEKKCMNPNIIEVRKHAPDAQYVIRAELDEILAGRELWRDVDQWAALVKEARFQVERIFVADGMRLAYPDVKDCPCAIIATKQ